VFHDFLAGVPLHDVWDVDLLRMRSGITLDEFLRAAWRESVHTLAGRAGAPDPSVWVTTMLKRRVLLTRAAPPL
jgi:hypothetical protein